MGPAIADVAKLDHHTAVSAREVAAEDVIPARLHDLKNRGSIPGRDVVGQALGVREVALGRLQRIVREDTFKFSGDIGRQSCVEQLKSLAYAVIVGNRHEKGSLVIEIEFTRTGCRGRRLLRSGNEIGPDDDKVIIKLTI